ncbi:hypothetical protein KM043_013985 [Ampulex compressa]|nr:hypothetical protein KM043_013985 [Ampulex compressa]
MDWLVMRVRDEIVIKNEIKNIITSMVREELKDFKKKLEAKQQQDNEKTKKSGEREHSYQEDVNRCIKDEKRGKAVIVLACKSVQEFKQLKSKVESKLGGKYQITEPKGFEPKLKILNLDEEDINFEEDQIVDPKKKKDIILKF